MSRTVTLDFYPEAFVFNIAHFTIFSPTHRERWHGHSYSVAASVTSRINEPGITFDYQLFKNKLSSICAKLNYYFILPERSPYLQITGRDDGYRVVFDGDEMVFLKKDVILLPIENTTLEDFSQWFIEQLSSDGAFIQKYGIAAMTVKVFNSRTQSASAHWAEKNALVS